MDLRQAVNNTLAYARFFKYPLSAEETHFWFITPRSISLSAIKKYLPKLTQRERKIRINLYKNTHKKINKAKKLVKLAKFIPTIKLLTLTGSTAIGNSKKNDDIDLMIVTSANTLWITRPIFLLLLTLKFSRRYPGDNQQKVMDAFCPNLWLDTKSLQIPKRMMNLYTAHEVLQVKPLLDRGNTYQKFIKENSWTKKFLANAYSKILKKKSAKKNKIDLSFVFFPLNLFLFFLQYIYMLPKLSKEKISLHSAFFHKIDFSSSLIEYLNKDI